MFINVVNNKNLIITPHIGGATVETWRITEEFIVKKFAKYLMNHNLN